ncbi:hypothetical protein [Kitasatospora acidiphila]|uniref:hypothetical protein n=1 Tax=Kitasatospora acidiphila TaxID=2567942 RepID=UPI002B3FFDEE|nr:hypothetical protein [Kitasatospora acidiphila]
MLQAGGVAAAGVGELLVQAVQQAGVQGAGDRHPDPGEDQQQQRQQAGDQPGPQRSAAQRQREPLQQEPPQ